MNMGRMMMVAALSASASVATAGGFDGPFAELGVGFANSQTSLGFPGWLDVKVNDNSFVGQVAAGYSRSFGQFNLAASVFYVIGNQNAGGFTDSGFGSVVAVKLKNTWGVTIEPGFNVNETTLAYVTLGYGQTQADFIEYDTLGTFPWEQRLNGYIFGAGVKYRFNPKFFAVADLRQTNYQGKSVGFAGIYPEASLKPNALTGFVGLGYLF